MKNGATTVKISNATRMKNVNENNGNTYVLLKAWVTISTIL